MMPVLPFGLALRQGMQPDGAGQQRGQRPAAGTRRVEGTSESIESGGVHLRAPLGQARGTVTTWRVWAVGRIPSRGKITPLSPEPRSIRPGASVCRANGLRASLRPRTWPVYGENCPYGGATSACLTRVARDLSLRRTPGPGASRGTSVPGLPAVVATRLILAFREQLPDFSDRPAHAHFIQMQEEIGGVVVDAV